MTRLTLIFLLACGGSEDLEPSVESVPTVSVLEGDITWTVQYDVVAEAAGSVDCAYTRHYIGVEDATRPWLCPECEVMWRADIEVTEGRDCFDQIATQAPAPVEFVGRQGAQWFRTSVLNAALSAQGDLTEEGAVLMIENATEDIDSAAGGTFRFAIAGAMTVSQAEGSATAEIDERPNTCGWSLAEAPAFVGPYTADVGDTVPDGVFLDDCAEPVRLHELLGQYTVIDISAIDCPPCRTMAAATPDFVERMESLGVPTRTVTLLAPSLSAVLDNTTTAQLEDWSSTFGLDEPILADRGWGFVMATGETGSYPTSLIVSPDMEVIGVQSGFGSFASFEEVILEHAGVSP